MKREVLASAAIVAGSLTFQSLWGAATWHVAPEGDDTNNSGESWASPLATPNAAVMKAARGDTILLSNGVYRLTKMLWVGAPPRDAKGDRSAPYTEDPEGNNVQDLTICGLSGDPEDVVLDGQGQVSCIYSRNRITIRDLTVCNGVGMYEPYGYLQKQAGGINCNSGSSTVSNCIVRGCVNSHQDGKGSSGGGLTMNGANAVACATIVEDCVVSNVITAVAYKNGYSLYGGGASFQNGAFATNCVFRNNRVVQDGQQGYETYLHGGGVNLSSARMSDCRVYGNSVTNLHNCMAGCGGGVSATGTSSIENCLIYNNSSTSAGGGVFVDSGAAVGSTSVIKCCTVTNNTVYPLVAKNTSSGRGSGVYVTGKNARVENCLIGWNLFSVATSDTRAYEGGGLGIGYSTGNSTTNIVVCDSLIISNSSPRCGGVKVFRSSDITISNCVVRANQATVAEFGGYSGEGVNGALVTDCWFLDNKATTYAAWLGHANYDTGTMRPVRFRNCFVAGNVSKTAGTYVTTYMNWLPLYIENCTIVSNNFGSSKSGFVTGNPWASTYTIPNTYSNLFVDSCVVLRNGYTGSKSTGIYDFATPDVDDTKPYANANFNFTLLPTNITRTVTSQDAKIAFTAENGNIGVSFTDVSLFRDAAAGDYRPASADAAMVGAAEATAASWMGNSHRSGALDMGDGTYTVSQKGLYGVTIARNNAQPRLSSTGRPTYGCFEWFLPFGLGVFFR